MRVSKAAVFILCAALVAPSAHAENAPNPEALLLQALAQPAAPYKGRVTLTRWHGSQVRSEEANVYFRPPQTYRMEFLAPSGIVDRVVLTDSNRREVQLLKGGRVVGTDDSSGGDLLSDQRRGELLLSNYRVTIDGTEKVLSRDAWVVNLTPNEAGKPRQKMLIDRVSNVILEVRRVGEDSGTTTQFTRFEPNARMSDDLFTWLSPRKSSEEGTTRSAATTNWPDSLPGGFSLVASDLFVVQGQEVRQYRYSDGLANLSIFVTSVAVEPPSTTTPASPLSAGMPETLRQWRAGRRYFTAVGDVPAPLLARIEEKLR